jgi:hypothetical protein
MKKLITTLAVVLVGFSAFGQGILDRFTDPEKGSVVFIEKGNHAYGVSGGYRSFSAIGDAENNIGYSIFSLINIGDGRLQTWNVRPSFSTFIADDISLGVSLDYSGYLVDSDLNLDLRDILGFESASWNLNVSNRSLIHHRMGGSLVARKYLSFFGSKTFGVFGEGRLFANYGYTNNVPRAQKTVNRERVSQGFGVGIKLAGGLAVMLRDGSAITISVPIFSIGYNATVQDKKTLHIDDEAAYEADPNDPAASHVVSGKARMSQFNAARDTDLLGIQFVYVRYIKSKK